MAKFLPVIGEIYTAIESTVLLTSAGLAKVCGDDKAANELLDSAGNAWTEYTETNLIANPINGLVQESKGNYKESNRLKRKYEDTASSFVDSIPVVGHVKGIVHYAAGDTEKGHRSMEASTRTAAVLTAGVVTGGVGAGLAVGAAAGIGTGVAYDGAATIIDKAVNDDKAQLHGTIKLAEIDEMNPNELFGSIAGIVGDGMTGISGNQLGKNIRSYKSGQKNLQKSYKRSSDLKKTGVDPKTATKVTMDAAKESKNAQAALNKKVNYATTEVFDKATGEKGVGHSHKYNARMRVKNYKSLGYKSKGHARRATGYDNPSHLQKKYPDIKQMKKGRPQAQCAEHPAFNELYKKNLGYKPKNAVTATVYKTADGTRFSLPRCENCSAYGPGMGNVVTDCIPPKTPVPISGYVADGWMKTAAAGAVAGGFLNANHTEQKSLRLKKN